MSKSESPLAIRPFSYTTTKAGKVLISHHGKQATVLQGRAAQKFIASIAAISPEQAQLLMAKATGQYKFGNERASKQLESMQLESERGKQD